jgi:hypothetical protein
MESDILFIQPSFGRCVARTIDFWGILDEYNTSSSTRSADELALATDLHMLGTDFNKAYSTVLTDLKESQKSETGKD